MLKLLNVLELWGLFGSFWDCIGFAFGLLLACVVLRCGVSVWIVVECFGSALDCIGFALGVFGIVEVL